MADETPDLAAALISTQRREERELCKQLRLQPRWLSEYRRRLLAELKPLGGNSKEASPSPVVVSDERDSRLT